MAKITWLGEDGDDVAGPSFTTCFDRKFRKGEAVDVTDPDMIARAKKNQFFDVQGADDEGDTRGGDELDDMNIGPLREVAETEGVDHAGLSKPQLRDAIRKARAA